MTGNKPVLVYDSYFFKQKSVIATLFGETIKNDILPKNI